MHIITQSCVLFLWMHILTFVKSQDCTLDQFINGRLYDSNFDTTDLERSYAGGRQVRVSCNVGYSGFFKLICVEGKWQSRGTKCQPRSCGHPGDAQFADFQLEKGDDFVFGSQVVYNCHKGYQMVSRTYYRRCMADGWDGVVPVCEAQKCPVILVSNNVQVIGDPEEATYGNVVRFSCKSNAEVLSGDQEIYCNENGEWSGTAPQCKEAACPVPHIENGNVLGDIKEYKEHDILHFECAAKFQPMEERPSKCIKHGSSANWSPTPGCEPIKCKLILPPLEGTTYEPAFRNVFSPGDTVTINCGHMHWIGRTQQTSAVTTCKEDGKWSIEPPCKVVTCPNQRGQYVSHWGGYQWQQIFLGTSISYSCQRGYRPTGGNRYAQCTREGWRPQPLCEAITCKRRDIVNAETADFKDSYDLGEKVKYSCRVGYEGGFSLTCDSNGWRGEPNCKEILCKKPSISNANIIRNDKNNYRHNERVQYACKYDDEKEFSVICDHGVWSGIKSCAECPDAKVAHGWMVSSDDDKVYYTCDEGYKLFTTGWWGEATCEGNMWSGLQRCIEISKCGELPVISNGDVTPEHDNYGEGESIPVTCKEGYSAQLERLTCLGGKWNLNGATLKTICTPTAKHCSTPPRVENAVVTTSYQKKYLSGSEVTYLCRNDYTLEGEATIRCNSGKWEKRNIKCTLPTLEQ